MARRGIVHSVLMDAFCTMKTRRAVRAYEAKPIPREILEDIIDCARLAATAINIQPWEFVVVTDTGVLSQIAEATDHGKHIAQAAACVAVLCRETKYYLEDGSAATQNILLAARAHGLGSCWVAGDKKEYAREVCRIVGAPSELKLISLVPMGYPAETPSKEKRPLGDVLHWEKY
jgi:nitroreductase